MLRRSALICAGLLALASAPSHATIAGFDTANRTEVANAYTGTYVPLFSVDPGWTGGDVATCAVGITSPEHQLATINAANFYRVMAGLPQVGLVTDATAIKRAREAAMAMAANGRLDHNPVNPPFTKCLTASAYVGAGASNLALGQIGTTGSTYPTGSEPSTGPNAIVGYITDEGNGGEITNGNLGHRRWILYSKAANFATGDIPNKTYSVPVTIGSTTYNFYYSANALRVMSPLSTGDLLGPESTVTYTNATGPTEWIAWPSPNFVPYQMMPVIVSQATPPLPTKHYWSVSHPAKTFTAATTVKVTTALGANVPVTPYPLGTGYGDNTLQFNPTIPDGTFASGMDDTSYKVEVRLAGGSGTPDFCYTVTVFDPAKPAPASGNIAPDLCNPSALLPQTVAITSNTTPIPGTATVGDTYTPTASGTPASPPGTLITFGATGACDLVAGQVTFKGFAGASNSSTCTVTASREADTTYSAASTSQTITVNRKSQSITFDATTSTNLVIGSGTYTLPAATGGGSGQPVTYGTTSLASVCTVASGVVTPAGVGPCVVTANQAGNNDWAAAPQATWNITISTAPLLPQAITSFNPAATGYVGISATLSATGGGGSAPVTFSAGPAAVCSTSGINGVTLNFNGAGICTVTANQLGDATHSAAPAVSRTVTVSKQSQTITFNAQTTATRTYAPAPGNTFPIAPLATSTNTTVSIVYTSTTLTVCSVSGTTVTMLSAGTCTIAANQASNPTYDAAAQKTVDVTINKANQTLSITSTPPSPAIEGNHYTVATSAPGGSGLAVTLGVSGDCTISGSVVTFTAPASPPGSCVISASRGGDARYNSASATQTIPVLVTQSSLVVTHAALPPPVAVGDTSQISVTGAAPGATITYVLAPTSTPGTCSVDAAGLVTITALTGNCIVTVQAAGVAGYVPTTVSHVIYLGPFAGGGTAVPTLGEWALALLAALTTLLTLPALRRRTAAVRR